MTPPVAPYVPVTALTPTCSRPYREGGPEALRRAVAVCVALALSAYPGALRAAPPATSPATAPATQTADVEVREWVVFVADAGQPQAGGRSAWNATLPPFMTSRRENAPAEEDNRPTPMGVMRLTGEVERDAPVDVLLTLPNGSEVEATWPKAQVRPGRILWNNLYTDETAKPADFDPKHWMAPLRQAKSALVRSGGQAERFLMYDVAVPYKSPLQLKADKIGALHAANTGDSPLLNLTFYKKRDGKWTRAVIASLAGRPGATPGDRKAGPATKPDADAAFDAPSTGAPTTMPGVAKRATGPTTRPAAAPAVEAADARIESSEAPAATGPATTTVSVPPTGPGWTVPATRLEDVSFQKRKVVVTTASRPSTDIAPTTTQPTTTGADVAVTLAATTDDEANLLGLWRQDLAAAGVSAGDVGVIESILRRHGLSDQWMTAIYRLDPAEMDRLLPLEIVPAPRKITRIGLVIARGLDPSINEEIDRLIVQCGDPDYARRKAATNELIALGQPAKSKVEKAVNDKDPEIAERAEMILGAIEKKKS